MEGGEGSENDLSVDAVISGGIDCSVVLLIVGDGSGMRTEVC